MTNGIDSDSSLKGIAAMKMLEQSGISDAQLRKLENKYFKEKSSFDSSTATHKIDRNVANYTKDLAHNVELKFASSFDNVNNQMGDLKKDLADKSISKADYKAGMTVLKEKIGKISQERQGELNAANPFNNEVDKFYIKNLQDIASNVNHMTRQELRRNLDSMNGIMNSIGADGGDDKEFIIEQYGKTVVHMQNEYERRSGLMTRAMNATAEVSEQYLDLQTLYAGFVDHNPLARVMFKMGGDFIKRWRENKKAQKALIHSDLRRKEMATLLEKDKQKDASKERKRSEELDAERSAQIEDERNAQDDINDTKEQVFGEFAFPQDEYSNTGDAAGGIDPEIFAQIADITGGKDSPLFNREYKDPGAEAAKLDDSKDAETSTEDTVKELFSRTSDRKGDRADLENQKETNEYRQELLSRADDIVELLGEQNKITEKGLSAKGALAGAADDSGFLGGGTIGDMVGTYLAGKYGGKALGMLKGLKGAGSAALKFGGAGIAGAAGLAGKAAGGIAGHLPGLGKVAGGLAAGGGALAASGIGKSMLSKLTKTADTLKGTFSNVAAATAKATGSITGTLAKEGAVAAASKGIGKSLLKKIPGISILAGIGFGIGRLLDGDLLGAGAEVASGIAGTFVGPGTALSLAIDASMIARDVSKQGDIASSGPASDPASRVRGSGGSNGSGPSSAVSQALSRGAGGTLGLPGDTGSFDGLGGSSADLFETIAHGEGTSDAQARKKGYDSGYDVTLGYGAYDPKGFDKPVSQMTLGEVKKFQKGMLNNPKNKLNSSAVGKPQLISGTLREMQQELGLSDDAMFDKTTQDAMAEQLLKRRGLDKFKSGDISRDTFQNNLAKEWASVARSDTGRSHYGQNTGTSSGTIQSALDRVTLADSEANGQVAQINTSGPPVSGLPANNAIDNAMKRVSGNSELDKFRGGSMESGLMQRHKTIDFSTANMTNIETPIPKRTASNLQRLEGGVDGVNKAKESATSPPQSQPLASPGVKKHAVNRQSPGGSSPGGSEIASARNPDSSLQRITDRYMSGSFA